MHNHKWVIISSLSAAATCFCVYSNNPGNLLYHSPDALGTFLQKPPAAVGEWPSNLPTTLLSEASKFRKWFVVSDTLLCYYCFYCCCYFLLLLNVTVKPSPN